MDLYRESQGLGRQGDLKRGCLREVFQRPHYRPVRKRNLERATVPGVMNNSLLPIVDGALACSGPGDWPQKATNDLLPKHHQDY